MQVSIIIPTYNRVQDLDECLNSIIVQTKLPKEIIVVDDSDDDQIADLIGHRKDEFKEKAIFLRYIRNERERSLTIARNIGVENATEDVILFLDSDVILDKDYIQELIKVYEEKPGALGVQGYITNTYRPTKLIDMIDNFLFIGHLEKNKQRILPSGSPTYADFVDKIISCEWLSGANQSYKKEIFEEFKFDECLKKYSYKEDIDFSYRIFKKYPNSLFMTPYAKLIHNVSQEGRIPKRELINMKEIHNLYFFHKNMNQTLKNKLIYLWARVGYLIFITIVRHQYPRFLHFRYLISAYIMCIKYRREIKRGDLGFLIEL